MVGDRRSAQVIRGTGAQTDCHSRESANCSAKQFCGNDGTVVTFQKNAWESLRREKDPAYELSLAKQGKLIGRPKGLPGIKFIGTPPLHD